MNKTFLIIYIVLLGLLCSCRQDVLDNMIQADMHPVQISVRIPAVDTNAAMEITDKTVLFNDLNMGKQYAVPADSILWQDSVFVVNTTQPVGFYDVEISITMLIDSAEKSLPFLYQESHLIGNATGYHQSHANQTRTHFCPCRDIYARDTDSRGKNLYRRLLFCHLQQFRYDTLC